MDAHPLAQILHRRGLVSLFPEDFQRPLQQNVTVELARSCHTLTLTSTPPWLPLLNGAPAMSHVLPETAGAKPDGRARPGERGNKEARQTGKARAGDWVRRPW